MPLRYTCDEPGLEENWLDIDGIWSYREKAEFMATGTDEAVIEWARRKIEACHIVLMTGEIMTDPARLAFDDGLLDADLRVGAFIARALVEAVGSLGNLGNANARLSSNGRVKLTMTKTTAAAPD